MKKIVLLSLLFISQYVFSQSYNPELKVIPASPTVAEIGRYGLAKAGHSDGSFSTAIPLYEYKTKYLSLPISISYNTNGLKVDKIASRVGMDWSLNVGGSIGRMVLGNPDETLSAVHYPSNFPNTVGDSLWHLIEQVTGNTAESVPDIYTVSFNGNSGRFLYFNGQIIKLEQNSLDIQHLGADFVITDNEGIKYIFDVKEYSSSYSSCSGHPYEGLGQVPNGWLLSKIIHPYGDTIFLKYKTVEYSYSTGVNQTSNIPFIAAAPDGCSQQPCASYPLFQSCVSNLTNQNKLIDKIYSNYRGVVQFIYAPRPDIANDSLLRLVRVYDAIGKSIGDDYFDTTPVREVELEYNTVGSLSDYDGETGSSIDSRIFLTNVTESGNTSGGQRNYRFYYNNLDSLPKRLSFSQDHFGFFNGKDNNSLIPVPMDYKAYNYLVTYGFGNRNPDWRYAKRGTLSKIVYPTGGYDSIVYEANNFYNGADAYNCSNPDTSIYVYKEGTSSLHHVNYYVSDSFRVNCTQEILLSVGHNTLSGTIDYPIQNYYVGAGFMDGEDGDPADYNALDIDFNTINVAPNDFKTFRVLLSPGVYRLVIQVQGPARGYGSFAFFNSYDRSGNMDVPGVRVREILTYTGLAQTPEITGYQYTDSINSNRSSGMPYVIYPNYKGYFNHTSQCTGGLGGGCVVKVCHFDTYSSDNFYNLYSYGGNNVYYSSVFEKSGRNSENGYTEHRFVVAHDVNGSQVSGTLIKGCPLSNFGMLNGFEYQTKFFKQSGSAFSLLKEISKHRNYDDRLNAERTYYYFQALPGLFGCQDEGINYLQDINELKVSSYMMLSKWIYEDSVVTKDYDANGNVLTSTQLTVYNNTTHQLPSEISTFNSKGNKLKVRNYYPGDALTIGNANFAAARDTLYARHIYAKTLRTQLYTDTTLQKEYNHYYVNGLFIPAPYMKENWEAISSNDQKQSEVNAVDIKGNILELKTKTAAVTSYIWDYKNFYPVAEIINAGQSDVAYTSFEADGTGNWTGINTAYCDSTTRGITGKKYYNQSDFSFSKSGLGSSTFYVVSYWSKNGAYSVSGTQSGYPKAVAAITVGGITWTLYEHLVTGQSTVTVSGSGSVDELRLHPKGALMSTYAYTPLVGLISQCDAKGRISYYEYDGLGRLKAVRDQNQNVLKKYEYKYALQ